MTDCIIVLDFGAQYAQLISRRIRELSVYSELLPHDTRLETIKTLGKKYDVKGIILSGGPASVADGPKADKRLLDSGIPILGLCYGHQLIAHELGGDVRPGSAREYGRVQLTIEKPEGLLEGLAKKETVWMSHGDTVFRLPPGFERQASTGTIENAVFQNKAKRLYGVQFHPEVKHTEHGMKILENFTFKICKSQPNWKMGGFIEKTAKELKEKIGEERVIMGLSGGVDSSVAAALIHKAIGDNLHCVYVDHGLVREGDPEKTKRIFEQLGFRHFYIVDASKQFLGKLKGVEEPEKKRKIISEEFVKVFEEKAKELEKEFGKIKFLGQGTIYPDRIESAQPSKNAAKIKSHHNIIMGKHSFELVEPLADLYKDEVRKVGAELGMAREILIQWPFPGPGLAVRCIGEVTEKKLAALRKADRILEEEIRNAGLYEKLWQAFPVYLPVKTVGVMGDHRTYEDIMALRIVESIDAMTANFAKLDWDLLERVAGRIVNEIDGINRVVYDITNKPPATIEFE